MCMHSYLPAPVSVQAFTAPVSVRPAPGIIRQWSMTKHIQFIRRQLHNKLHSESGASLMVALLFFILCATVGSVVLAAASSSAGRTSEADTNANIQRYSLESAAQTIVDSLRSSGGQSGDHDFQIVQSWDYHEVRTDYATTVNAISLDGTFQTVGQIVGASGASKPDSAVITDSYSIEYSSDDTALLSKGDYVLWLDEESGNPVHQYTMPYPAQMQDKTNIADDKWKDSWNGSSVDYVIKNSDGTAGYDMASGNLDSLNALRNQMAEAIYRHYWYDINNTSSDVIESLSESIAEGEANAKDMQDPWRNGALENLSFDGWQSIVKAKGSYTVATEASNPLVIEKMSESMLPVYADVSMNQNFNFVIHLYCGTQNSENQASGSVYGRGNNLDKCDAELWVIFMPSDAVTGISSSDSASDGDAGSGDSGSGESADDGEYAVAVFTQNKYSPEQSDVTALDPLYRTTAENITITILPDSSETIADKIKNMYNNNALIKWGEGGNTGKKITEQDEKGNWVDKGTEYHFSAYEPVFTGEDAPTSTVNRYQRSVTFNMDWNSGFITTENPDAETSGQ